MVGGVACFYPGCTQPVIGQCSGYKGACGQFFCATHSSAKLCSDCAGKQQTDELQRIRTEEEQRLLDRLFQEYSRLAEDVHQRKGLYKEVEKQLGLTVPQGTPLVQIAILLLLVGGAVALNVKQPVFGVLLMVAALLIYPVLVRFAPLDLVLSDSYKTSNIDIRSASFQAEVVMAVAALGVLVFTFVSMIFLFIIGAESGNRDTELTQQLVMVIGGGVGTGLALVILNTTSGARAKRSFETVLGQLENQKPGFRSFYSAWAKARKEAANAEAKARLKGTLLAATVLTGAAVATYQDDKLRRDIHDIADAARRLPR